MKTLYDQTDLIVRALPIWSSLLVGIGEANVPVQENWLYT